LCTPTRPALAADIPGGTKKRNEEEEEQEEEEEGEEEEEVEEGEEEEGEEEIVEAEAGRWRKAACSLLDSPSVAGREAREPATTCIPTKCPAPDGGFPRGHAQ
jgi:hypothetical protein